MPRLTFTLSTGEPVHFDLETDRATIGRTPDNDLMLPDPTVSSQHGEFTRHGDSYIFRDNASTNGSRINGEQPGDTVLKPGDHLVLGTCEGIYAPELVGKRGDQSIEVTSPNSAGPADRLGLFLKRIELGDATAINLFPASQEANAHAQARLCSAWAASSNCGLEVVLLKATAPTGEPRFLLLEIGSLDAQWNLTGAVGTDDFRRLELEVLTTDESMSIAPVTCYENFPQPGCVHTADAEFANIVGRIRRGEYAIV